MFVNGQNDNVCLLWCLKTPRPTQDQGIWDEVFFQVSLHGIIMDLAKIKSCLIFKISVLAQNIYILAGRPGVACRAKARPVVI